MELLISVVVGIATYEAYAWLPRFTDWLLEQAIRRLPPRDQDRCREEWKANLDALPNTIVRVVHALSFCRAAHKINAELVDETLNEIGVLLADMSHTHLNYKNQLRLQRVELEENQRKALDRDNKIRARFGMLEAKLADARAAIVTSGAHPTEIVKLQDAMRSLSAALPSFLETWDRSQSNFQTRNDLIERNIEAFEIAVNVLRTIVDKHSPRIAQFRKRNPSLQELDEFLKELTDDIKTLGPMGAVTNNSNDKEIALACDVDWQLPQIEAALTNLKSALEELRQEK